MNTVFYVYIELADGDVVWWAETPDVAGLSLAAGSLAELRSLIDEAARHHLGGASVRLELVAEDAESGSETAEVGELSPELAAATPGSVGSATRRTLVRVA